MRRCRPWVLAVLAGIVGVALSACAVLPRSPVPEDGLAQARPYGIEGQFRAFGDIVEPEVLDRFVDAAVAGWRQTHAEAIATGQPVEQTALALSGGGPDGAFGAGFLTGWTARGDRPTFGLVSGISTGALMAPFAFLGPDYDDELTEIYTRYTTKDLIEPAILSGIISGTALGRTTGLRRLIERYADAEMVERIGKAYREGRTLLIGTTNLDASRPIIWNIGAIAASGHPDAVRLIHDVMLASASIPIAFPPVLIPVEFAGKRYDEMHVDGGATQQVMLFSPSISALTIDRRLGVPVHRTVYVIVNNKLQKPYNPPRARVTAIGARAVGSLISGSGSGDLYKIFAIAERDGMALNIVSVPRDFDIEPQEPFDPVYMRALYDLGHQMGKSGDAWMSHPPDYAPRLDPVVSDVTPKLVARQ